MNCLFIENLIAIIRLNEMAALTYRDPIVFYRSDCRNRNLFVSRRSFKGIFSLILGIIFGTFSSIFIASAIALDLRKIYQQEKTPGTPSL